MDQLTMPAGTIIQIGGMPFELASDTAVLGSDANYKLACSQSATSLGSPNAAHGSPDTSSTNSRDD